MAVFRTPSELTAHYHALGPSDILVGRLRLRQAEDHILLDLISRGVRMIPSALCQLLSRSKVAQARILGSFMLPNTLPIYDRQCMMQAVSLYNEAAIDAVVVKLDRANGGEGIMHFASVEEVNSLTVLKALAFPFILQPLLTGCKDLRVLRLGIRTDCYCRHNQYNFRHNLHCGGRATPCQITPKQEQLCHEIMERGGFPYAFIDLLISREGACYLSEINLRGGMRGSHLDQPAYLEQVEIIHQEHLDRLLALT